MSRTLLLLAMGAGATSFLIGVAVRAYAGSLRLADLPNARSLHATPTPRGGGLGIVAGTVGGLLLLSPLGVEIAPAVLATLAGGGLVIAVVSFIDDISSLPPAFRLCIHLAAGVLAVYLIGPVSAVEMPIIGRVTLGLLAAPLTVLWVVAMTNIYNFMDGIDGLAGAQAVTATAAWALVGCGLGRGDLLAVSVLIVATGTGFLLHNWSPARLFMGDVGSAFLGYSVAVIAVIAAHHHARLSVVGALLVWPFIFDATFTLIRRTWRRDNLLEAHRSHLYQRLVTAGWSHRDVCGLYLTLAVLAAATGLVLAFGAPWASAIASTYMAGSALLVCGLVRQAERA